MHKFLKIRLCPLQPNISVTILSYILQVSVTSKACHRVSPPNQVVVTGSSSIDFPLRDVGDKSPLCLSRRPPEQVLLFFSLQTQRHSFLFQSSARRCRFFFFLSSQLISIVIVPLSQRIHCYTFILFIHVFLFYSFHV